METQTIREENFKKYSKAFELVEEFINTTDFEAYQIGEKVQLTDEIFFFKLNYEPKAEPTYKLENHQNMIDVHYAYKGTEGVIVCNTCNLELIEEYDQEKDVEWYKPIEDEDLESKIILPGEKLILFPGEAHEPEIREGSKNNTKIVFKIKY